MPIDNLSKITSRSGINTTILLEAGNANVTGIITAAGFDGPFTGGGGNNAGIVTAVGGLHVGTAGTVLHAINDSDVAKVGIGTTIPTAKLEISHPTHTNLVRLKRTTGNAGDFRMQIGGSNPGVIFDAVGISSDFIFQTQGNEIMRLDSLNRKVGIGTDIPADKLSIHSAPNSLVLGAKDTTRGNHIFQILADDSAGNGELRLYRNSGSGTHEKTVEIASSGDSYFLQGSIGVGEETPDSKLDILHSSETNPDTENLIHLRTDPGAGYVSRGLFIKIGRDLNYDNSGAYYDIVGSSGNSGFHAFQVQGNDILRINKDGNVGIGSTNPNLLNEPSKFRELTIGGRTEGAAIHLKDDNNNVQAGFFTSDNTGAMIIRTITNHPLMFRTNNAVRFFIDKGDPSGGGVGISTAGGTIAPDGNALLIRAKSSVGTKNGHIMLTGDGATVDEGPQIVFSESGSGSNYAGGSIGFHRKGSNSIGDLVFGTREASGDVNTTTTERLRINSNGLVGIGTNDPTSHSTTTALQIHDEYNSQGYPRFRLTNAATGTGSGSGFEFQLDGNHKHGIIRQREDADIYFMTNSSHERLRITNSGIVTCKLGSGNSDSFAIQGHASQGRTTFKIMAGNNDSTASTSIRLGRMDQTTPGQLYIMNDKDDLHIGAFVQGGHIHFLTNESGSALKKLTIRDTGVLIIGGHSFEAMAIQQTAHRGLNFTQAGRVYCKVDDHWDLNHVGTGEIIRFRKGNDSNTTQTHVGQIDILSSGVDYKETASDSRLKKNVETWADEVLPHFKTLQPKKFNFNWESDSDTKSKGYMAQDVTSAFPEAFSLSKIDLGETDSNGDPVDSDRYMFSPGKMVPYLMKALQEEIGKREALEARISALEGS